MPRWTTSAAVASAFPRDGSAMGNQTVRMAQMRPSKCAVSPISSLTHYIYSAASWLCVRCMNSEWVVNPKLPSRLDHTISCLFLT